MQFLLDSVSSVFCAIVVCFLTFLYICGTRTFNYWKDRGVVFIKPLPFIGNSSNFILRKKSFAESLNDVYNAYKNEKFVGTYTFNAPTLLVRDPDLINKILTSDFNNFHNRRLLTDDDLNPLNRNLNHLTGARWRNLRRKLSPVFTSGKLKTMFGELEACTEDLVGFIEKNVVDGEVVDTRHLMTMYASKVIGSVAFGCDLNTLNDSNSEFLQYGQGLFEITFRSLLNFFIFPDNPGLKKWFPIKLWSQDIENFFVNFVKTSVAYRENNNYQRNDFLQLLINLRKNDVSGASEFLQNIGPNKENNGTSMILDDSLMAANVFIFLVAGLETTSATLSTCLLELAANPDMQDKLRAEVMAALQKNEKLSYDVVKELKYMEKVISETLRKYSIAVVLNRVCTERYKIPGTDVILDVGTKVLIPVYSIHKDPRYYPDPEKFEPERFSEENKKNIQNGTYLPFGDGPRICIGLRFALLEMKIALAHLLSRYKFSMTAKTTYPMVLSKKSLLIAPEDGIWLKISRIDEK